MNPITMLLERVAEEAAQVAGCAATCDPSQIAALLAGGGPVVFVDIPTLATAGMRGHLVLTIPVHVVACPPGGPADHEKAHEALCALLPSWAPSGEFRPVGLQTGDLTFPAYRGLLERQIR